MSLLSHNLASTNHALRQTTASSTRKIRPLGALSDFVVEIMPQLLLPDSPIELFDTHLNNLGDAISHADVLRALDLSLDHRRIACLDLALIVHAAQKRGRICPPQIQLMLLHVAEDLGRAPSMLYEDCVLFNPIKQDPRLFSTGLNAAAEREFLGIHARIEACLERALDAVWPLLERATSYPLIDSCAKDVYRTVNTSLDKATTCFADMRVMPLECFESFRDMYAGSDSGSRKGVSGRFSETINSLRIIVEGKRLLDFIPTYFEEMLENLDYYPSTGRDRLRSLIKGICMPANSSRYACLNDILVLYPDSPIAPTIARIRQFSEVSVRIHYRLANKYAGNSETGSPQ